MYLVAPGCCRDSDMMTEMGTISFVLPQPDWCVGGQSATLCPGVLPPTASTLKLQGRKHQASKLKHGLCEDGPIRKATCVSYKPSSQQTPCRSL